MGDRTDVQLTIPTELHKLAEQVAPDMCDHAGATYCEQHGGLQLVTLEYYEVNYGELEFLPKLVDVGIPYTRYWYRGGEYNQGEEFLRFTPEGDIRLVELYEGEENFPIDQLTDLMILGDMDKLTDAYNAHMLKTTPLSWDNQVEYGKLFRTKKLILNK
jgi:hypothetical protein